MIVESSQTALEALTDIVLFITIYAAVLTTIYAIGETKTRGEQMGRAVALWMCAFASVVLIVWLIIGIVFRVLLVTHYGG